MESAMSDRDRRPTLDEALQRRDAYLQNGIPREVMVQVVTMARATRANLFRDLVVCLGRGIQRRLRHDAPGAGRLHVSVR
jgi:hypothetical protein